jgi:hypothetical protein
MRIPTINETNLSTEAKRAIKRLTEYNGFIYHQKSIVGAYLRGFEPISSKPVAKRLSFILGSNFITRHPISQRLIGSTDRYEVSRRNVSKKTAELNRRIINYFVSQSYEVLESYLYGIAAELCMKNKRKTIEIKKMINCADKKSYRKLLKEKWKNTEELYSNVIVALLPKMKEFLIKNKSYNNFQYFLNTVLLVRHAITHSEGILRPDDIKSDKHRREYLSGFFGVDSGKRSLQIDCTEYGQKIVESLSQIIFLIEEFK